MVIDARNFDDVKPFIRSILLSSEWQQIENLVKRNVAADIFLTFCMAFPDNSVYPITYTMLDKWNGVTIDTLEKVAKENELGTATITRMSDALGVYIDDLEDTVPMYIVSRFGCYCGAGAVLDEDIQQALDRFFEKGCYVLPSSVHEVICIDASNDVNALCEMVRSINRSVVDERERLSDHVFKYEHGSLSVVA